MGQLSYKGGRQMTELKTFKEIHIENFEAGCDYGSAFNVIRQEAIKWIKRIISDYPAMKFSDIGKTTNPKGDEPLGFVITEIREVEGQYCCGYAMVALLKHFFNITEDELK